MRIGREFEEQVSPNIALIKYWGKLDKALNIPLNGSISLTLDSTRIFSKCKSRLLPRSQSERDQHSFRLYDMDGALIESEFHKKFPLILDFFRAEFCSQRSFDSERTRAFHEHFDQHVLDVHARNNFPSSAGLASSASGVCALVLSLARVFDYFSESESELKASLKSNVFDWLTRSDPARTRRVFRLCTLLRVVSGSSSRSLFPGLVLLTGVQSCRFSEALSGRFAKPALSNVVDPRRLVGDSGSRGYFSQILKSYHEALGAHSVPARLEPDTPESGSHQTTRVSPASSTSGRARFRTSS